MEPISMFFAFCAVFRCETGLVPPFFYFEPKPKQSFSNKPDPNEPVVRTTLGFVQGYLMEANQTDIYAFTGIPYGEEPQLCEHPRMKRPWNGILKATSVSPYCHQFRPTGLQAIRGQTDCLYLDVFTPKLPPHSKRTKPLPVIAWLPAGANIFGRSSFYGPAYFLEQDVILVNLNIRMGTAGFISTGDEACPGNWAMKDFALAIEWIHSNIKYFGGDPNHIVVGGISSGAVAAHSVLFANSKAMDHVTGLIAVGGSMFLHYGLDVTGRVKQKSNMIALRSGCPMATGRLEASRAMVNCLRRNGDPEGLHSQYTGLIAWGPVLEKNVTGSYISELPEDLYAKGLVRKIPIIMGCTEHENSLFTLGFMPGLPVMKMFWGFVMNFAMSSGFRNSNYKLSKLQLRESARKITKVYLNRNSPPAIPTWNVYTRMTDMFGDLTIYAPVRKAIEFHHKFAPTYVYINKQNTYEANPLLGPFTKGFGASHASDYLLLFNNSRNDFGFKPGSDFQIASKNLINIFSNFAEFEVPYFRTQNGELHKVWHPVEDSKRIVALEVGLVHNISMTLDPLWDRVARLDKIPM